MILSTYERLVPLRISYLVFWPVVSFFVLIIGEAIRRYYGADKYWLIEVLYSMGIAFLPLLHIQFSHHFQKMMDEISPVFWSKPDEYEKWKHDRTTRIFTFRSLAPIAVTAIITVPGMLTIFLVGGPSRYLGLNIFALCFFPVVLIVCGHGLYICLDLMVTLRELVLRPISAPFFMMEYKTISKLQNYFAFVAAAVTFCYIWLVIAIWKSPYGLSSSSLQVWLTVLAFYPVGLFVVSLQQIHVLMRNIKLLHLATINNEVQGALKQFRSSKTKSLEEAERLEKLMEIQTKVENMKEWPIGSQASLTFLGSFVLTFVTAITQVIITYLRIKQ